jgi:DNA-binding NtrC family response regulator
LIIDDDPLVRRVMRRVLSRSFDIEEVESAESAVMRLDRGERFDVVVCDLMLGDGLSGRAFYDRTLARDPALASGFIMTSGSEALVGAIGTDRFLQKPFSGDTLLAVVERIADQQATEAA